MADVPASDGSLPVEFKSAEQGSFGPFLLSDLQDALAAYVQKQGQGSASQNVCIVLNGPVLAARLTQPEIVPFPQGESESFLLSDLQDALAAYVQKQGADASNFVFIYSRKDDSLSATSGGGGSPPKSPDSGP